ncbi:MAG: helix-turn-helix domain-containing protein [Atopobiaceae bacterium]|jgi:transposase-like protein|nr:helix-turn-helix domain-containing protein [Atopobiaceae bacterium]MCI2173919.1 helix-turn-helix domain-containing protein [Atopobiaceae bacterium]MCI2207991.1 helix-turn-helix domain-containing protein [Atopobiaceae bacterium]
MAQKGKADAVDVRQNYTYAKKLKAVRAHVDEDMPTSEVMKRYGILSKSAFFRWCAAYRDGGAEAIKPKRRGRPRKDSLR